MVQSGPCLSYPSLGRVDFGEVTWKNWEKTNQAACNLGIQWAQILFPGDSTGIGYVDSSKFKPSPQTGCTMPCPTQRPISHPLIQHPTWCLTTGRPTQHPMPGPTTRGPTWRPMLNPTIRTPRNAPCHVLQHGSPCDALNHLLLLQRLILMRQKRKEEKTIYILETLMLLN